MSAGEHLTVAFGTDERTTVTERLVEHLRRLGHEVSVIADGEEWPEVGRKVGEAVTSGRADRGVVCCTTGTGVSIAANKVPGVRAALCGDASTSEGARRWNDANVLALSLRLTTETTGREVIEAFLGTAVDESERRVIERLEAPR